MYRVQVGKLLWKRHIDQLRELAGSKVADVEPKSSELPEVDLPEMPDASMPVPTQDPSPQPQFVPNETPATPLVEVPPSGQMFHKKKIVWILLSQPFLKNLDVVLQEFDRNLNV